MISTKILVVITLLILSATSIVCLIVTFIKDNNEANESITKDCRNCKASKYCDEIPDMCCYNKRVVAELIESECDKRITTLFNERKNNEREMRNKGTSG